MPEDYNPPTTQQGKNMNNEEKKLEYLRREEIRTMEKDIKKLREMEAERERMRITALEAEAKKTKVMPHPKEEMPKKETVLPEPPQRPSPLKKFLVRIGIILLLFCFLTFFYWYFGIRKPAPIEEKIPLPKEEQPPPEGVVPEKPEVPVSPSLISIETTRTFEVSENEESLVYFNQLMNEELPRGSFTRVVVKNIKEGKVLGLKEFFEVLEIKVPENFYQKLENDFTLFIYSQEEGKRLGFVTKIKESEGLANLLKSWEKSMEKDFENFFKIMQGVGTALIPYFKNASHRDVSFRYQTFSIPHFGICYSIYNQYFIFTSSGKSMMRVIELLKK